MSCRDQGGCRYPRRYKPTKEELNTVRTRLNFSESPPPKPKPTSGNRYEDFKRVSESHSSHEVIPPMYTSAELGAVPDSFMEFLAPRMRMETPAPVANPYAAQSIPHDIEMPASFLEFCQERIASRAAAPPRARSPSPPPCASPPPPCVSPPRQPSHYGQEHPQYDFSGYADTMPTAKSYELSRSFSPPLSSTRREASTSPPRPCPGSSRPTYNYPNVQTRAPNYGLPAKYLQPCSPNSSPSPDFYSSSVTSGDLLDSPRSPSRTRKSRGSGISPFQPVAHSTADDAGQFLLPPGMGEGLTPSGSSILRTRRRTCADELELQDFLQTPKGNKCPACPTLGVTPVQSSSSFEEIENNKQNISRSIETELAVREAHEKSQLEADLVRWQQARRKLVMNTANMGS